ncbi:unnamed protein product, partial [Pylaiella littoralis]
TTFKITIEFPYRKHVYSSSFKTCSKTQVKRAAKYFKRKQHQTHKNKSYSEYNTQRFPHDFTLGAFSRLKAVVHIGITRLARNCNGFVGKMRDWARKHIDDARS